MPSISVTLRAAMTAMLLVMVMSITSCGSSEANGKVTVLPPRDAVELIQEGRYVVIDLRSPEAFEAGHVRGAVNLPAGRPEFEKRLLELDRGAKYLMYSRDGEAAEDAAGRMVAEGFDQVADAGAFGLLAIAGAPVE